MKKYQSVTENLSFAIIKALQLYNFESTIQNDGMNRFSHEERNRMLELQRSVHSKN